MERGTVEHVPLYPAVFQFFQFPGKKYKYFIGQLLTDCDPEKDEYDINYLRKSGEFDGFYFPLEPDMAVVSKNDIVLKLLPRIRRATTKRQANILYFPKCILKVYNFH